MAQTPRTYNEYTGNGSLRVFGFSFPYQAEDEVFVEVNDTSVPFVFDSTNSVRLQTAPASGATVRILRSTEAETMLYQFQLNAPFLPEYVDANNEQILYALQETNDDLRDVDGRISDAVETETAARIAADTAITNGYQSADSNLQSQILGLTDIPVAERPVIQWHAKVIPNSVAIPADVNAFSAGPSVTIADGQAVTVGPNSAWTIMDGIAIPDVGLDFDEGTL